MLGAMYGATRGESGRMMPRLTRRYPRAIGLVEEAARAGERGEVVHTLLGRGSPVPHGPGGAPGRARASRPTRGSRPRTGTAIAGPGGGSPATSSSRAPLPSGRCAGWPTCATGCGGWAAPGPVSERPHLVFFLHDEVVVHTPEHLADAVAEEVRAAAGEAGRLLFGTFPIDFPLDVAVVRSWADAD